MMNTDEIKMEVNIAGERLSLSVPFSRQEAVRRTEAELAFLFKSWGEKFPKKSPKELLAMMAYKFAASYFDLLEARKEDADEMRNILDLASKVIDGSIGDEDADAEFPLY